MALHSTLPIYQVTLDLLKLLTQIRQHLPRNARSIGDDIYSECRALVIRIYRANSARDKVPHLEEMLEHLQVAQVLFRVAADQRLIALKHHARAIELTASIGKQATGWRNKYAKSPAA